MTGVGPVLVLFRCSEATGPRLAALRVDGALRSTGTEKGPPEAQARGDDRRGTLAHDGPDAPHQGGSHTKYQESEADPRLGAKRPRGGRPSEPLQWKNKSAEHGCEANPTRRAGTDANARATATEVVAPRSDEAPVSGGGVVGNAT